MSKCGETICDSRFVITHLNIWPCQCAAIHIKITVLLPPPYSPDLAPVHFLLPKWNTPLKRQAYAAINDTQSLQMTLLHNPARGLLSLLPEVELTLGVVFFNLRGVCLRDCAQKIKVNCRKILSTNFQNYFNRPHSIEQRCCWLKLQCLPCPIGQIPIFYIFIFIYTQLHTLYCTGQVFLKSLSISVPIPLKGENGCLYVYTSPYLSHIRYIPRMYARGSRVVLKSLTDAIYLNFLSIVSRKEYCLPTRNSHSSLRSISRNLAARL